MSEERPQFEEPPDAEHWPTYSREYLRWAYEQARAMSLELGQTASSLQKRATLAAAAHWAIVGWLLTSSLGPHLLALHACCKIVLIGLMLASGTLVLLVVIPRTVQTSTIQALIGPTALMHPVVGTLKAAIDQMDLVYQNQQRLTNRKGTLTAWCQIVAAVGVLMALILAVA